MVTKLSNTIEQFTIDDYMIGNVEITQQIIPFEVNDQVRVIVPNIEIDSEAHYYLSDFENKRGAIRKFADKPSWQYHIDFDGKIAIVYHHEIKYW